MAVYKVPQDVEADDKLIGPFSFRQFIYLIVVAISAAGSWGLAQLFIPLAILPLPFILFFGALALPLRKDQPMEAYLTAIVSFYFLKSRRRFWEPDGIDSFVTIIAPKNSDIKRTKDLNQEEAEKRFSYLAGVVDSHGWAVRGQDIGAPANLSSDLYKETAGVTDMMDGNTTQAHNLDKMIDDRKSARRDELMTQMQQPVAATIPVVTLTQPVPTAVANTPAPIAAPSPVAAKLVPADKTTTGDDAQKADDEAKPHKPKDNSQGYLTSDQRDAITYALGLAEEIEDEKIGRIDTPQALRQEVAEPPPTPPTSTSAAPPSAATIDLATNRPELTVETISKEAQRIKEKEQLPESEVFISLH